MKEEKGGVLHVLFLFVGITLICIGVFYIFTDEHIELREENTGNNTNTENKDKDKVDVDVIKQISLMKNVDTEITLKNGNAVLLTYAVNEESNSGKFLYGGKAVFETQGLESCNMFYLYNNSIVVHCSSGTASSGYLYIIDSNGTSKLFTSINDSNNNSLIPESISLKEGKIVVNASFYRDGNNLIINNEEIDICQEDVRTENNIKDDFIINSDYTLSIKNDEAEFTYLKTNKTVADFVKESCKTVEE